MACKTLTVNPSTILPDITMEPVLIVTGLVIVAGVMYFMFSRGK